MGPSGVESLEGRSVHVHALVVRESDGAGDGGTVVGRRGCGEGTNRSTGLGIGSVGGYQQICGYVDVGSGGCIGG